MISSRTKTTLAFLAVAGSFGALAHAFQVFIPNPNTQQLYVTNGVPTGSAPFVHWDLRKFNNGTIPWSVSYGYIPDTNLDGVINNTDQTNATGAITAALATWTSVTPAVVSLSMQGVVPAGQGGITRDNYNVVSFPFLPDEQCVAVGAMAPAPGGMAANRRYAPVVGPGGDGLVNSARMVDDQVSICVIDGGNGNVDTTPMGDDVVIVAQAIGGGEVPGGCSVLITAGPNGVLNSTINNAPPLGTTGDDRFAICIVAGVNGQSDSTAIGGASATLSDDQQCVGFNTMPPNPNGVAANRRYAPVVGPGGDRLLHSTPRLDDMVSACIVDGGDGNVDTTPMGDDVIIVAQAAGGEVPAGCTVLITAGPNGVLNSTPNNMPNAGAGDDRVSTCIIAGVNIVADTFANNMFSENTSDAGALTGIFFNNQTGELLEADVEMSTSGLIGVTPSYFDWSVNPAGQRMLQGVVAGPDMTSNTTIGAGVPATVDTQLVANGTATLSMTTLVVSPGTDRILTNTTPGGDDWMLNTTDIQQIVTHEIGHTLGIAHPVNGRSQNDVQQIGVGGAVAAGAVIVSPGAGGTLDSQPMGDDILMGNSIVEPAAGGDGIANTWANNAQFANATTGIPAALRNNNIMNPFYTSGDVTVHALSVDDITALNWLYTPDLGDAPDPFMNGGPFNRYQTNVTTTTVAGTINGVNFFAPGLGPQHLFGFVGPMAPHPGRMYNLQQYEWLGAAMDGHPMETSPRNPDMFDDGFTIDGVIPMQIGTHGQGYKLNRGGTYDMNVTISHTNQPGRYAAASGTTLLQFNGYFDFNEDRLFDNANDLTIWWRGTQAATSLSSANLMGPAMFQGPPNNRITLKYRVTIPADAAETGDLLYGRLRLDYGEDEGRQANTSGDNGPAVGAAQFGEVEDYLFTMCDPPDQLHIGCLPGYQEPSIPLGQAGTLQAWVERDFVGLKDQFVTIRQIGGSGAFEWPDGSTSMTNPSMIFQTDENGKILVQIADTNNNPGDIFVEVSVAGTSLKTYCQFDIGFFGGNRSADLNGDGEVNTADLGILISRFGSDDFTADINGDGVVDTADLGILLSLF